MVISLVLEADNLLFQHRNPANTVFCWNRHHFIPERDPKLQWMNCEGLVAFIDILLLHEWKCIVSISGGVLSTLLSCSVSHVGIFLPSWTGWKLRSLGPQVSTSSPLTSWTWWTSPRLSLNWMTSSRRTELWLNADLIFILVLTLLIQARVVKGFLLGRPLAVMGKEEEEGVFPSS